jgi:hypothetical protein
LRPFGIGFAKIANAHQSKESAMAKKSTMGKVGSTVKKAAKAVVKTADAYVVKPVAKTLGMKKTKKKAAPKAAAKKSSAKSSAKRTTTKRKASR